jgi:quercetin dioxygenase-like cupin family protein
MFLYVIRGAMEADVAGKKRRVTAGDVIHVPQGAAYRWTVRKGEPARYAAVRSTPRLEAAIGKHGAADNWRG